MAATLYDPFPAFKPSGRFIEAMNQIIRDRALAYGFSIVDVDKQFAGNETRFIQGYSNGSWFDLMSPPPRPIFPNEAGHKLIGHLVKQSLQSFLPRGQIRTRRFKRQAMPVRKVRSGNRGSITKAGRRQKTLILP